MMVLVGGVFGSYLGHKGKAFMNRISVFIKQTLERSPVTSTTWGHSEKAPYAE